MGFLSFQSCVKDFHYFLRPVLRGSDEGKWPHMALFTKGGRRSRAVVKVILKDWLRPFKGVPILLLKALGKENTGKKEKDTLFLSWS